MSLQKNISAIVLRTSLGFVFIILGANKFSNPNDWVMFIPAWVSQLIDQIQPITIGQFLQFYGATEILVGFQIFVGMMSRFMACLAAIFLILIILNLGFDSIGIRDIGLLGSAITIVILGAGDWSVDTLLKKDSLTP